MGYAYEENSVYIRFGTICGFGRPLGIWECIPPCRIRVDYCTVLSLHCYLSAFPSSFYQACQRPSAFRFNPSPMSEMIWTEQKIFSVLALSILSLTFHPCTHPNAHIPVQPGGEAYLEVWPPALMLQYTVGPTLDIRVQMERKVVDGSLGPQ